MVVDRPSRGVRVPVEAEVDKLGFLRGLGADTLDISVLPAERRRFLATMGRRLTGQALERRDPQRRVSDPAHAAGAEDRQALLDDLLAIVTDLQIPDEEIGGPIRGEKIGWERLRAALAQAKPRLPRDHGHLAALDSSYSDLRQFTPAVAKALKAELTEMLPFAPIVSLPIELDRRHH